VLVFPLPNNQFPLVAFAAFSPELSAEPLLFQAKFPAVPLPNEYSVADAWDAAKPSTAAYTSVETLKAFMFLQDK
jgi:hypothetical protein